MRSCLLGWANRAESIDGPACCRNLRQVPVQMIGANPAAIEKGEAREIFKQAMLKIGLDVARSATIIAWRRHWMPLTT